MKNGTCVVNHKGWVGRSREVIQGSYEGDPAVWVALSARECVWGEQGSEWVYLESTKQMVSGVPASPC